MELSRRRFMQAAGVVAASAAFDLELTSAASAVELTAAANIYGGYKIVRVPPKPVATDTDHPALQSFGFNGNTLYICQQFDVTSTTKAQAFLRFTQYNGPQDTSFKYNEFQTDGHGGQIGVNGSTIWAGDVGHLVRGTFTPSVTTFPVAARYNPTVPANLRVNTDAATLVLRDGNDNATIYSQAQIQSAGPNNPFPDKIGTFFKFPSTRYNESVSNTAYEVSNTTLHYAVQTDSQKTVNQFSVASHNMVTGTTTAWTDYHIQSMGADGVKGDGYELEGMTIVGGTRIVGINHGRIGDEVRRSFSLFALS